MWTLEDVKKIKDRIWWDLTPEAAAKERPSGLDKGGEDRKTDREWYFFCIDVWGCKASLALIENHSDQGVPHILQTDIPDQLLEEAVFKAGGALIMSACYPIDDEIRGWIRERL